MEKPLISAWATALFFSLAYKPQMTMEFDKNCIEMEEKSMGKYMEETVVDSTSWISWNSLLKIWAELGKNFKCFIMFWFFYYL